jgi:6-phosphogluconolactonase
MKPDIKIFDSAESLVQALSESFIQMISESGQENVHVALSGGSTPRLFFKQLAQDGKNASWQNVHFYWGDERCVPENHPESNFGMTKKYFFDRIDIPDQNLHRIKGEEYPTEEAERYGRQLIQSISRHENNYPVFDWVILGLGEDGHTASIFPRDETVIHSKKICEVAEHPQTSQKRITLTLPVINSADKISFLVTGVIKSNIIKEIFNSTDSKSIYPATMVQSNNNPVEWYLDKTAASKL